MTFRLTLQSDYRNLTDEEVEAVARSVVAEIAANLGGELRGG
jgi:phenylalanyl-tRNA synthetase beta subunit